MKHRLTIADAQSLSIEGLLLVTDAILAEYDPPDEAESTRAHVDRLRRTIEEVPAVYRWFCSLHAHFDHWTDAYKDLFGQRAPEYKGMRQRRDAMEKRASAARLRYESASRTITVMMSFDTNGMPTGRRGPD